MLWRTLLSNLAWDIVQKYIAESRPNRGLYPGQSSDRHLTEQSVQMVFEEARRRTRIWKKVSFHALGLFFATHLMENGTDFIYVVQILCEIYCIYEVHKFNVRRNRL
ncbi:Phage integrase family protein [Paenibacillus sp. OK003]|nr:Phage integrase family protein [Paenibacillus sp. OK003]